MSSERNALFPMFEVGEEAGEGKCVYLHFGQARIKICESVDQIDEFAEHIRSIQAEIHEEYSGEFE